MLGHMIEQTRPKTAISQHPVIDRAFSPEKRREGIIHEINTLHALSRRGLWGVLFFLLISTLTLYLKGMNLLALMSEDARQLLGSPPPAQMVNVALTVSIVSAFILIIGRLLRNSKPEYSWINICLPTVFYPLYFFCNSMEQNFSVVFAAGLTILFVEHASMRAYYNKVIEEEKNLLKLFTG